MLNPIGMAQLFENYFELLVIITKTQIDLFPNPSSNILNVRIDEIIKEKIQVNVLDLQGKNHLTKSIDSIGVSSTFQLDISGFSAGIYLLKIQSGKGIYPKKFVVR